MLSNRWICVHKYEFRFGVTVPGGGSQLAGTFVPLLLCLLQQFVIVCIDVEHVFYACKPHHNSCSYLCIESLYSIQSYYARLHPQYVHSIRHIRNTHTHCWFFSSCSFTNAMYLWCLRALFDSARQQRKTGLLSAVAISHGAFRLALRFERSLCASSSPAVLYDTHRERRPDSIQTNHTGNWNGRNHIHECFAGMRSIGRWTLYSVRVYWVSSMTKNVVDHESVSKKRVFWIVSECIRLLTMLHVHGLSDLR